LHISTAHFSVSPISFLPSFPRVPIMTAQLLPLSSVSSVLHGAVCISPWTYRAWLWSWAAPLPKPFSPEHTLLGAWKLTDQTLHPQRRLLFMLSCRYI
jgi:hypothetical protein